MIKEIIIYMDEKIENGLQELLNNEFEKLDDSNSFNTLIHNYNVFRDNLYYGQLGNNITPDKFHKHHQKDLGFKPSSYISYSTKDINKDELNKTLEIVNYLNKSRVSSYLTIINSDNNEEFILGTNPIKRIEKIGTNYQKRTNNSKILLI